MLVEKLMLPGLRAGPEGGAGHWARPRVLSGWSPPNTDSNFSSSAWQPGKGLHVWVAAVSQVA